MMQKTQPKFLIYQSLRFLVISLGLSAFLSGKAQILEPVLFQNNYPFINHDSNRIDFHGDNRNFEIFYDKLQKTLMEGKGQVNIVSIGGSHIQADVMTGELRDKFQGLQGGICAGRGYVFPYRMAKTNNPSGYKFSFTGNWQTCRNTDRNRECNLGMGGINASTTDSNASFTIKINPEKPDFKFNSIKFYHQFSDSSLKIYINSSLVEKRISNPRLGYTEFIFKKYLDSLEVKIVKADSSDRFFELYGLNLQTSNPGIYYHNLGINGAAVPSFNRCLLLEQQLSSIKPDLVILGLGINDAYGKNFDPVFYEHNYDTLISRIRKSNPDVAILFTTNNDSYLYRKHVNRNGEKVREAMINLAQNHDAAVWDMYTVMGGLNSIVKWEKAGLARADKVHFTGEGYVLLGDMLFEALMKSFGDYLEYGVIPDYIYNEQLVKISAN